MLPRCWPVAKHTAAHRLRQAHPRQILFVSLSELSSKTCCMDFFMVGVEPTHVIMDITLTTVEVVAIIYAADATSPPMPPQAQPPPDLVPSHMIQPAIWPVMKSWREWGKGRKIKDASLIEDHGVRSQVPRIETNVREIGCFVQITKVGGNKNEHAWPN